MRTICPDSWLQVDINKYVLTKMSTSWPNTEDELTKWHELTKLITTNWLKYELTWVQVDWEPDFFCGILFKKKKKIRKM